MANASATGRGHCGWCGMLRRHVADWTAARAREGSAVA